MQQRRVGAGDQDIDGAVIKAAENPFEVGRRRQVVGGGAHQHCHEADEIRHQHPTHARMGKQCDAAQERRYNACAMNHRVRPGFARTIDPATFEEGMHYS